MVRLKFAIFSQVNVLVLHLHSTLVRLKSKEVAQAQEYQINLHSTLVRLKYGILETIDLDKEKFTFHIG